VGERLTGRFHAVEMKLRAFGVKIKAEERQLGGAGVASAVGGTNLTFSLASLDLSRQAAFHVVKCHLGV
jgi:hypothetical protein